MREIQTYQINHAKQVKRKLLRWAQQFEQNCVLESNTLETIGTSDPYSSLECLVAIGAHSQVSGVGEEDFDRLKSYVDKTGDWVFGYLAYDLKNQIEDLSSNNDDFLKFPVMHFFQPEIICELRDGQLRIGYLKGEKSEDNIDRIYREILNWELSEEEQAFIDVKARVSKEEYLNSVGELKKHIAYGDIYEVNYCQEFYAEDVSVAPIPVYERLNAISKAPFSSFYRNGTNYLASASPERFMKKTGQTLVSQPIKGTKRRGESEDLDQLYKEELAKSQKEQSENVMIVDIVRNDLSKSAVKGSVEVEDLFGIYTFEQVHQMISTVKCKLEGNVHPVDAIKDAFPMGSMTGAPKIRAMQLIEEFELTKRGLFSGAVGYITPELDFDFNVVIRSMFYNTSEKYLSFMVGGAITDMAEPEAEYAECMVKAKAMFDVLNVKEPAA